MESAKALFRKENILPFLGPCMITFAIPLMVPGLTLTLVGFKDQAGIAKFGGLHVFGIFLLIVSGLLIVAGCVLKCTLSKQAARVSPQDDEEEGTPSWSGSMAGSHSVKGKVHSTHAPLTSSNDKVPRSLSGHFDYWPDQVDYAQVATSSEGGRLHQSSTENLRSPASNSANSLSLPPSHVPVVPRPVTTEAVARDMQSKQEELSHDMQKLVLDEVGGKKKQTSTLGAGNFMESDSENENERTMTKKYADAAQTLPTNSRGLLRGSSMSTSISDSSSSSSSFSSGHSLLNSFDVEQDPPGYRDAVLAERKIQSSVQVHRALQPRQGFMLDNETQQSLGKSSSSKENELSSPSGRKGVISGSKKSQTVEKKGLEKSEAGRLFTTREGPCESQLRDSRGSRENERTLTNSEHGQLRHLSAGVRDTSSSSLEQNASSVESPSHGAYSVRSPASEELWDLRESPMDFPTGVEERESLSRSRLFPGKHRPQVERPTSPMPVPLQSDSGLNTDGLVTVFGRSRETLPRSSSSQEGSPAKRSLSRNIEHESRSDELSTQYLDTDDFNAEAKQGKNKKKKKKKKKKLTIDTGHKPETETSEMQQDMQSQLSPLRSIMRPQHNSEHHVHWPDA
ncbi:micronuclear linker histone polyprotein-like [Littorina saxatilis]|uniref:Uncharacterized protein n=1 Tax=Littorina saxatilis TaxID=31220 RepID=A0AAN9BU00_9CAEN